MDILREIADRTICRVEIQKKKLPLGELARIADSMDATGGFPFERALRRRRESPAADAGGDTVRSRGDIAFICEVKKASPSKGVISEEYPYVEIAREYESAGADAISVLTEPFYFLGDGLHLGEIANAVHVPLLRKDFTVDEYMIYEAKALGASAVLLICSILEDFSLAAYIETAHSLGMSVLAEAHDEREVKMALGAGARIIGINNRDLKTFEIDMENSIRLRDIAPKNVIFVSESGVRTAEDVEKLRAAGVDAVLVGETLMRSADKAAAIRGLKGLPK